MRLDLIEPDGVGDALVLIECPRVVPQFREIDEAIAVTLEVSEIDGVEAHERRKQAPVRFRDPVTEQEFPLREPQLKRIERREQLIVGLFIGRLRCSKSRAIDPVVDGREGTGRPRLSGHETSSAAARSVRPKSWCRTIRRATRRRPEGPSDHSIFRFQHHARSDAATLCHPRYTRSYRFRSIPAVAPQISAP